VRPEIRNLGGRGKKESQSGAYLHFVFLTRKRLTMKKKKQPYNREGKREIKNLKERFEGKEGKHKTHPRVGFGETERTH